LEGDSLRRDRRGLNPGVRSLSTQPPEGAPTETQVRVYTSPIWGGDRQWSRSPPAPGPAPDPAAQPDPAHPHRV